MDAQPRIVSSNTAQEQAAWRGIEHGEPTLAVVDEGRFVGLVLPTALMEVLLTERVLIAFFVPGVLLGLSLGAVSLRPRRPLMVDMQNMMRKGCGYVTEERLD
ncbi:hypothetical protein [Nesterenkonia aerolata]|uniref:Uncharacterized protein n=1 Tax=Nesterenkonia aerolata TaxID=3074079 RepID=A0ABU2DUU0_9MICC|nr:hypothetical protein [Nesterenkonia sp. LY-0111]MDR8020278.1 hypothetical protein [Nesterenkonia sp. LY-0111]